MKVFTERLNAELASQHISKYELAKQCGLSKQTVCNWCDGVSEPRATQLVTVCKALNVSSDYLLGMSDF